jgi:coat protein Gp5
VNNQFLNAQEYANTMLLLLKNQLVFGRLVDGQFKDQVTDENGLTINVKRPPRFIATSGATLQPQDLVTGTAPVTVDQYKNVHISVGDLEYVQSYNALMQNETMKSAASTLAHDVDKFIANKTLAFNAWIAGTAAGTRSGNASDPTKLIASPAQAMAAHTRLMANGVPNADLSAVVTFDDGQAIRGSLLSDYTPDINRTALEKVRIPIISEIDWYASQQCASITTGSRTQGDGSSTGATVNGANQNVNYRDVKGSAGSIGMQQTLNITGGGANATIAAGEVFTIQNVYAWDWRQQVQLADLQQFTVVNAVTLNGSGAGALTISPAIIVQGTVDSVNTYANSAFGTVGTVPVSGAYIKWAGAASTALTIKSAFHKRAISLVSARLQMPFTGVASFATDPDTGIAIRYWRGSDIATGAHVHRWDMIYGAQVMDPFLGARVCGT